jgi:hypothetical protein
MCLSSISEPGSSARFFCHFSKNSTIFALFGMGILLVVGAEAPDCPRTGTERVGLLLADQPVLRPYLSEAGVCWRRPATFFAKNWPQIGQKLARNGPTAGREVAKSWPQIGQKLARNGPKVGHKLANPTYRTSQKQRGADCTVSTPAFGTGTMRDPTRAIDWLGQEKGRAKRRACSPEPTCGF